MGNQKDFITNVYSFLKLFDNRITCKKYDGIMDAWIGTSIKN